MSIVISHYLLKASRFADRFGYHANVIMNRILFSVIDLIDHIFIISEYCWLRERELLTKEETFDASLNLHVIEDDQDVLLRLGRRSLIRAWNGITNQPGRSVRLCVCVSQFHFFSFLSVLDGIYLAS